MTISKTQISQHYATTRALLHDYYPHAKKAAIDAYVAALWSYDTFPAPQAIRRLNAAHQALTSSLPTVQLEN